MKLRPSEQNLVRNILKSCAMHMRKGFCFKGSQNVLKKIYREKQGSYHILGSSDAGNLKRSPVIPFDKRL